MTDTHISAEWQSAYRLGYLAGKHEAAEQLQALLAENQQLRERSTSAQWRARDLEAELGKAESEIAQLESAVRVHRLIAALLQAENTANR